MMSTPIEPKYSEVAPKDMHMKLRQMDTDEAPHEPLRFRKITNKTTIAGGGS